MGGRRAKVGSLLDPPPASTTGPSDGAQAGPDRPDLPLRVPPGRTSGFSARPDRAGHPALSPVQTGRTSGTGGYFSMCRAGLARALLAGAAQGVEALARLLGRQELRIRRVEVAALTSTDSDADAAARYGLRVGEGGNTVRAHALGKLERLREGLRLLSWRGLAAVGQQVPATVCGSVESRRAGIEPACNNPPLGVGVGEVRHPVRTHTFRERESVGAVTAGDGEA